MDYRQNMLHQRINQATSINDILPMLHHIELQTLKDILTDKINKMTMNETSKLFNASLSMETILPMDIIQHIMSFHNISNSKYVSKTFNKCHQKNKAIELKKKEKTFISTIQTNINTSHQTLIVDTNRTHLNQEEITLKYNAIFNKLSDAINAAKSGDKILIYNGEYGKYDSNRYDIKETKLTIDKNLQIIGYGNDVKVQYNEISIASNIYFKNIKFKIFDAIEINPSYSLFAANCDIKFEFTGIIVQDNATLNVTNCNFYGDGCYQAIDIDKNSTLVSVIGCMFTNCGENESTPAITMDQQSKNITFKCIDNLFKDNVGFAIGTNDSYRLFLDNAVCKYNRLKHNDFVDPMYYFCHSQK